jgi:hypothetical protein
MSKCADSFSNCNACYWCADLGDWRQGLNASLSLSLSLVYRTNVNVNVNVPTSCTFLSDNLTPGSTAVRVQHTARV